MVVSERDGYAHAYLAPVGENRGPPTQLTAGAWCVHRVHAVDEDRGWVYFTANERGPLERHLYRARALAEYGESDREGGAPGSRAPPRA